MGGGSLLNSLVVFELLVLEIRYRRKINKKKKTLGHLSDGFWPRLAIRGMNLIWFNCSNIELNYA